ncbi:MAG: peptidoglycan-binding protein [Hormoscilla sp. GM7CHS1pb]|nr:peptidoglycan-binding protein [Hormoscilla sp. GM7CHS1pb]
MTPLQSAGNSPEKAGWLDSYFGPVTELAVIKFQRDNQLRPDGVAGPSNPEPTPPAKSTDPEVAQ